MKRVVLLALVALLLGTVGGYGLRTRAAPAVFGNSCKSWVQATGKRVAQARLLIEPAARSGTAALAPETAAQQLDQVAQQQAQSRPPSGGQDLNGDLVEAMGAGVAGLAGTGGAAPETQLAFAKAIIYTAGPRLALLNQRC